MKRILLFLFFASIIYSCDKINPDDRIELKQIVSVDTTATDTTTYSSYHRVLIEDYTGHQCGHCPQAAEMIDSLIELYPHKIIPITVHSGSYAELNPPKYTQDYRTEDGDKYSSFFTIVAHPTGLFNRVDFKIFEHLKVVDQFKSETQKQIADTQKIGMRMIHSYNESSREISVTVKFKALLDLKGEYKLCVCLTEDSLFSYQKDYSKSPQDIPNYHHKHLFRTTLNTTWGETVAVNMAKDSTKQKSYNYTISSAYKAKNCHLIAYIYDSQSYKIVESIDEKLIK